MNNPQDAEAVNAKLVEAWGKVPAVKLQWALANAIVSGDPDLTVKVLDELLADQAEYEAHQAAMVHLCGHRSLHPDFDTATTFCPKCVAWDCTDTNCAGHQRWPDQAVA